MSVSLTLDQQSIEGGTQPVTIARTSQLTAKVDTPQLNIDRLVKHAVDAESASEAHSKRRQSSNTVFLDAIFAKYCNNYSSEKKLKEQLSGKGEPILHQKTNNISEAMNNQLQEASFGDVNKKKASHALNDAQGENEAYERQSNQ